MRRTIKLFANQCSISAICKPSLRQCSVTWTSAVGTSSNLRQFTPAARGHHTTTLSHNCFGQKSNTRLFHMQFWHAHRQFFETICLQPTISFYLFRFSHPTFTSALCQWKKVDRGVSGPSIIFNWFGQARRNMMNHGGSQSTSFILPGT